MASVSWWYSEEHTCAYAGPQFIHVFTSQAHTNPCLVSSYFPERTCTGQASAVHCSLCSVGWRHVGLRGHRVLGMGCRGMWSCQLLFFLIQPSHSTQTKKLAEWRFLHLNCAWSVSFTSLLIFSKAAMKGDNPRLKNNRTADLQWDHGASYLSISNNGGFDFDQT